MRFVKADMSDIKIAKLSKVDFWRLKLSKAVDIVFILLLFGGLLFITTRFVSLNISLK